MIENPELILADEPTGNLDSNTSLQVIKTLVHINETLNKTVVMVTHDPKMASYGKRTLFSERWSDIGLSDKERIK